MTPDILPARKERLHDVVYGQILDGILSDTYPQGARLPSEADLSQAFRVSRPVIREALMRLQADGFIQARRGSGTFVLQRPSKRLSTLVDADDLSRHLRAFEPRIAIEAEAARLAASRRTTVQLRTIRDTVELLRQTIARNEPSQGADIAFHEAIAAAAGNDYFVSLLESLRAPVLGSMAIGLELARERSAARRLRVIEEHLRIHDAIAAQDVARAETYMRHHLYQARAAVVDTHHLEGEPPLQATLGSSAPDA